MKKTETLQPLLIARQVISSEMKAIRDMSGRMGKSFENAAACLLKIKGKVIFSGVGKSGIIARKIAATFSSTGSPAIYLHPVDCLHGDLGVLTSDDAAIFISRSGNTEELLNLIPGFRRFNIPIICICGSRRSPLAKACDFVLELGPIEEACPFNLAPTSSTTATVVLGDALSIVLLKMKGFRKEDYALLHQAGTLGRRLQLRVADLMATGDFVPRVHKNESLRNAILSMTSKKLGMTTVVNESAKLIGILTDGDLRRILQNETCNLETPVYKLMTPHPKTVTKNTLAAQALTTMEQYEITSLVAVDENRKIDGVIHIHEIIKAGVV
jgi:arabinose-5-phosphate isomerase